MPMLTDELETMETSDKNGEEIGEEGGEEIKVEVLGSPSASAEDTSNQQEPSVSPDDLV